MAILGPNGQPLSSQANKSRPDLREIAVVSVRDRYSTYPSSGLTPEKLARILKEADLGDIFRQMELWEEIEEKDAHLASLMQTRKSAVLGLDWEILPASDDDQDKKIAEFVGDILYNLDDLGDAFFDLLDAIGKGFGAVEIMWAIRGGQAVIDGLKWRHQKKFTYGDRDDLRLLTDEEMVRGIELPPNKFIIHNHKARSGHPSRAGVFRTCVWMYLFKNYTVKDWVAFCEVYGMPLRLGKYEAGAGKEDKEALAQAVMQIGTDAAAIISKSTEIDFVEAVNANGIVFEKLANFCDNAMSKAVLGQTLTSQVGDAGSYAAAKVHDLVRQDILESDCNALSRTVGRDLIRPLVLFNFGPVKRFPWLKLKYERPEDQKQQSEIYKTLGEAGLRIPSEHVYEKFGIPQPTAGQEIMTPLGQGAQPLPLLPNKHLLLALAQGDQNPIVTGQRVIDRLADANLAAGMPLFATLMEPIMKIIQEAGSLEELRDSLLAAYPDMDTSKLEEHVAQAIFLADLYGRWTASG